VMRANMMGEIQQRHRAQHDAIFGKGLRINGLLGRPVEHERTDTEKNPIGYSRLRAFLRFSAPAILPVAARFTDLEAGAAAGTDATFESAVPNGAGDECRSLPVPFVAPVDRVGEAVIVFDGVA